MRLIPWSVHPCDLPETSGGAHLATTSLYCLRPEEAAESASVFACARSACIARLTITRSKSALPPIPISGFSLANLRCERHAKGYFPPGRAAKDEECGVDRRPRQNRERHGGERAEA